MSAAAWIMLVVSVAVLYGGLAVCITIAVRADRAKEGRGEEFLTGDE